MMTTKIRILFSPAFLALSALVIIIAIEGETLFHAFLHTQLHPLDNNHLLVGSTTAILAALLSLALFLRTRILSKKTENRESEQSSFFEDNALFHLVAEKSNDMIHLNDSTGIIRYVNPVTIDMLGYDNDEIINKPAEFFIHPENREHILEDMKKVMQGENIPPREIRLLKKSGGFLDVEVKGFIVKDDKEIKVVGAILRDISRRKHNEQLLQTKKDWEKTFNTMTDYVSIHDKNFKILKANKSLCELLGKKQDELIGKFCYQLFHNLDEPHTHCPHKKASETGHSVTEIITDSNIGFPLQITCSPLFDDDGEFQGSVHIAKVHEIITQQEKKPGEIIPICAACKKIRNKDHEYMALEDYFSKKYGNQFTHTVCGECQKKLYPEYSKS